MLAPARSDSDGGDTRGRQLKPPGSAPRSDWRQQRGRQIAALFRDYTPDLGAKGGLFVMVSGAATAKVLTPASRRPKHRLGPSPAVFMRLPRRARAGYVPSRQLQSCGGGDIAPATPASGVLAQYVQADLLAGVDS